MKAFWGKVYFMKSYYFFNYAVLSALENIVIKC